MVGGFAGSMGSHTQNPFNGLGVRLAEAANTHEGMLAPIPGNDDAHLLAADAAARRRAALVSGWSGQCPAALAALQHVGLVRLDDPLQGLVSQLA